MKHDRPGTRIGLGPVVIPLAQSVRETVARQLRKVLTSASRKVDAFPVFPGHLVENNGVPVSVTVLRGSVVPASPGSQPHLFDRVHIEGSISFKRQKRLHDTCLHRALAPLCERTFRGCTCNPLRLGCYSRAVKLQANSGPFSAAQRQILSSPSGPCSAACSPAVSLPPDFRNIDPIGRTNRCFWIRFLARRRPFCVAMLRESAVDLYGRFDRPHCNFGRPF